MLLSLALPAPYLPAPFSVPPAPALIDEFLIEIHAIGEDHIAKGALVLVVAVSLKRDFLPQGEVSGCAAARMILVFVVVSFQFKCSLHQLDLTRPPGLVETRLERAIETKHGVPSLTSNRLNPVGLMACAWRFNSGYRKGCGEKLTSMKVLERHYRMDSFNRSSLRSLQ